jgi:hypothetical protein
MKQFNLILFSILAVFFLFSCSPKKQFSSYSETEQEELYDALTERLDEYFSSVLQDDEQLQQLFIAGLGDDAQLLLLLGSSISENDGNFDAKSAFETIKENNTAIEDFVVEMLTVCKQWADDYNIDIEDWSDNCAEEFTVYYMLHLIEVISEME